MIKNANSLRLMIAEHFQLESNIEVQLREESVVLVQSDGKKFTIEIKESEPVPEPFQGNEDETLLACPTFDFRTAPTQMSMLTPCSLHKGFKEASLHLIVCIKIMIDATKYFDIKTYQD